MKRFVLIWLLCWLPLVAQAATGNRTLQTKVSGQGVTELVVHAGVGQLRVTPSPDDQVHVTVQLEQKSTNFLWFFHWVSDTTAEKISRIKFEQQQQGQMLTFSLQYPDRLDEGDVKQNWDIQVPAKLMLKIDMKVGQMNVNGIAGGVDASLNVGEIVLNIPRGSVKSRVNVGQIRVASAAAEAGDIHLSSTIGDTRYYLQGQLDHSNMHHDGLGRTMHITGKGTDRVDLEVNIGDVSLHLGEPEKAAK